MKNVAPSAQVASLLTANFNVPNRGKQTVVGTAAQIKLNASQNVIGYGFAVYNGSPYLYMRDPADNQMVYGKLSSDMASFLWLKKLNSTDVPNDYQNMLTVNSSGNALTFTNNACVYVDGSNGNFLQAKSVGSTFSSNAIKFTTTGVEAILNSWGISGSGTGVVQRFNASTGSVTWGHQVNSGEGPPFNQGMGIAESADGTVITYGVRVQGTPNNWTLRRVNFSNGNLIWAAKYYPPNDVAWSPTTMTEGAGLVVTGVNERSLVAVSNSSGNISWQSSFSGSGDQWHDLRFDSATQNFFGVLRNQNRLIVVNSSGGLVYERNIISAAGIFAARGVAVDSTSVYVFGTIGNSYYVLKMPKDGTGVGGQCQFADGVELTYSAATPTVTNPNHSKFNNSTSVSSATGTGTQTLTLTNTSIFTSNTQGI